jgi:hypothetical protein
MPVTAQSYIRPLRGGSQTHLLGASDGNFYVVKLKGNPQGTRILVNEWIAERLLAYLHVRHPAVAAVEIGADFIATNPRLGIERSHKILPPEPGWHFGSRFPGDPGQTIVYDVINDIQLLHCRNLHHFLGALVFDKWTGNWDSRQCVFFRDRTPEHDPTAAEAAAPHRTLVASMIDHGFCFNGPYWDFQDAATMGVFYRMPVYAQVRGWKSFDPWLEMLKSFPESILDKAYREIPQSWLTEADAEALPALLEALLRRRTKVERLIEDFRNSKLNPFPLWR